MHYSGVTTQPAFKAKKKIRALDTWRSLVQDGRSNALKWLQLFRRGVRLAIRTLLFKPVAAIQSDHCNKFTEEKVASENYVNAWFSLLAALIRHLCTTQWFLMRILFWLYRSLTDPPQQVGPESKYRKRSTGLSITPLDILFLASVGFLVLQFAIFLLQ